MGPPDSESEPQPATRSNRILGLIAAVGFSVAMWVFIAVAVLGLILKVVGPKGAEEGLQAATLMFNPHAFETAQPAEDDTAKDLGQADQITTLGKPAEPAPPKTPDKAARPPAK